MTIGLLLVFHQPLVQQAFEALVASDSCFHPMPCGLDNAPWAALLDAEALSAKTSPLFTTNQPTCCVVLAHAGIQESGVKDRLCGVPNTFMDWQSSWQDVATNILAHTGHAAHDAMPWAPCLPIQPDTRCTELESLTRRELDVLRLIAEGCSVRQIALTLHLAESTIDNHKSRLMKKLGVKKSIDLARYAYRTGLARP